jgi:hypothetical protein
MNYKYSSNVFINCPFDKEYKSILEALTFTISDCGYIPRCALEIQVRNWLSHQNNHPLIPAAKLIQVRYKMFTKNLPLLCRRLKQHNKNILFIDHARLVAFWLQENNLYQ